MQASVDDVMTSQEKTPWIKLIVGHVRVWWWSGGGDDDAESAICRGGESLGVAEDLCIVWELEASEGVCLMTRDSRSVAGVRPLGTQTFNSGGDRVQPFLTRPSWKHLPQRVSFVHLSKL